SISVSGDTYKITVVKSGTTFDGGITVDKSDKTYTYGDTITVKATPKATGIAARSFVTPTANQMALFVGSTQITAPVNVGTNGVYTMTYDTKGKDLAIGSNTITAKYVGNANMADYSETVTVTLNQKAITSASVNAGATKVYDGTGNFTAVALTPNASGILGGDTVTATADGTVENANVGATKTFTATSVNLGGAQAGYYSLAASAVSGNVAITKASATGVSQEYPVVNGLAKDYTFDLSKLLPSISATQEYGNVTYAVGTVGNANGVLTAVPTSSDIVNGKLTLKVASVADKDKTATVTISITSDNFTVTNAVITVKTVDKIPLTISNVTMAERVYNGSAYAYIGTPTFTNTTDNTAVTGVSFTKEYEGRNGTSYTKSETAPTNAGEYNLILTVSGASAATYAGTLTVPFAITQKEVTVKAKDKDILVGAEIPSLANPVPDTDYTVAGFIGTDTLTGTVSMSYTGTPDNTKHGSYPITISGGTASDNYTVKYENGTLTISIDVSLITAAITAADNAK
ncbi:MAG: YDG domain-containing protein, partial [Angelakisella sp.]